MKNVSELTGPVSYESLDIRKKGALAGIVQPFDGKSSLADWLSEYRDGVVLFGIPMDDGTRHVGGRIGSKKGPDTFRKILLSYGTTCMLTVGSSRDSRAGLLNLDHLTILDAGNIITLDGQTASFQRTAGLVEMILRAGCHPIGIGGSHDGTYGILKGLAHTHGIAGINIDSHFDVRPPIDGKILSGSPFYLALEDPGIGLDGISFFEVGHHSFSNSASLYDYLQMQKANILEVQEYDSQSLAHVVNRVLNGLGATDKPLFMSLDIDALDAAQAPGCSAPSPLGLPAWWVARLLYQLSRSLPFASFDIMEYDPDFDIDSRTGRLMVHLLLHYLGGRLGRI